MFLLEGRADKEKETSGVFCCKLNTFPNLTRNQAAPEKSSRAGGFPNIKEAPDLVPRGR